MSGSEELGSWSSRDADVTAVDAAIRRLHAGHDQGHFQTTAGTVVALTEADPRRVAHAGAVLRELTIHLPVRSLVVTTAPTEPAGLDAGVEVRTIRRAAMDYCVEAVRLHVRGPSTRHLSSVLGPFVPSGLPVTLWFPELIPRPDDPVPLGPDRVIIDSRGLRKRTEFSNLSSLADHVPVADLSWIRMESWRTLVASFFVGQELSPFLADVQRIDVRGEHDSSLSLAGWLASRLRSAAGDVHLIEAPTADVEVYILASDGVRHATLVAVQRAGRPNAHSYTSVENGPAYRRTVQLPTSSTATLIYQALLRPAPDVVWQETLPAVADLSPT